MKREISCCAVTWIRLSLTLNTHFLCYIKERRKKKHLYTRHNLLPAHFDASVFPLFLRMLVDLRDKMKISVFPSAGEQNTAHLPVDHFFNEKLEELHQFIIKYEIYQIKSVFDQLCPFFICFFTWKLQLLFISSTLLHEWIRVKPAFQEILLLKSRLFHLLLIHKKILPWCKNYSLCAHNFDKTTGNKH